jgi:hypothetical protein
MVETTVEGDLPTERKPESEKTTVAKLLFAFSGLYERWRNELAETRRYRDPRENDPDYEARLRRLEGDLGREEPALRMGDYHEGGGGKWDKWAMPGLVTLAVSGIIGNVVQSMTVSALRQEVTDLKLQVDKIERLVEPRYRGG